MSERDWPVAEFDTVHQLRVIAAATPGAVIHETVLPDPIERVWAVAADLEGELPHWLLPDIRAMRITEHDHDRLVAHMVGYSGLRARFDVVLRPGWCLMQSRYLVGGMAATTEGSGTRFAFLGGLRWPLRIVNPLLKPFSQGSGARALERFTTRVEHRG